MAQSLSITAIIGCFVLGTLAGCVDGSPATGGEANDRHSESANDPPRVDEGDEPSSTLPLNRTKGLSFTGCDFAKFTLASSADNFPYRSPPGWEEPGADLEDAVIGRMWACQEVAAFGVQTFLNVSMLWLGHGNMSDSQGRLDDYAYNDRAAEIVIAADPPKFAEVLSHEFDVRSGKVIIEDGIAVMENPEGRIILELSWAPVQGSAIVRETVFFINAAGDRWMELAHAHDSRGFWMQGTVVREGETPLDPWFEQTYSIPVADGYLGHNGTIGVTPYG